MRRSADEDDDDNYIRVEENAETAASDAAITESLRENLAEDY